MLKKIVVFDNGFGGELFADYVEKEIPILDVVRVIDWRNSSAFYKNPKDAREKTIESLRPYINHSDLIVISNCLVSTTSLKYLQKKFPHQKFSGFSFEKPTTRKKRVLILSTESLFGTLSYRFFKASPCGLKTREFACDEWAKMIDEGEYMEEKVQKDLEQFKNFKPQQIYLNCSHLADVKPIIRKIYGPTVSIVDGYKPTLGKICHELKLRGGGIKKK